MRSTKNERIEDGRIIISKSGKEYELHMFKEVTEKSDCGLETIKHGYEVLQLPEGEVIGSVTDYTTEARLYSLLERYEHPEIMRPVEFITVVRKTGNGRLYCNVGYAREWANIRLDDSFDIEITTKDGLTIADPVHHLSLMKTTYVIELTRLRRFTKEINKDGSYRMLPQQNYDRLGAKGEDNLLLQPDKVISIRLIPTPDSQDFFYADNL